MDSLNWYFILKFVLFIAGLVAVYKYASYDRNAAIKHRFDTLPDFKNDTWYLGSKHGASVAIDTLQKKICFINYKNKPILYDFNQILRCEFIYNSFRESTTLKQTFIGDTRIRGKRVAVNGSLYTPAGDEEMVKSMGLKVTMNNEAKSTYDILFIHESIFKRSYTYDKKYEFCLQWQRFFENLAIEKTFVEPETRTIQVNISSSDSSTTGTSAFSRIFSTPSTADEIQKLKNLLDEGALTQAEFEQQKAKLLK